jgi:signal transduction histidine kinase
MNRASLSKLFSVFGSTTFRLAIVYTLIFGLSVGGLFYFVFWRTAQFAEQQVEAAINADVSGFQEAFARSNIQGLAMAISRRVSPDLRTDGVYLLIDSVGNPLAGNMHAWPRKVSVDDIWVTFPIRDPSKVEQMGDVRALQFEIPGGYKLLVGRDVRDAGRFREQLVRSLNAGLALTLALGLIGGFIFSRMTTRRIEVITRTCRRIMSGDLTQRVHVPRTNDEYGRLALSINAMLDQIERLMRGMQQVSDNVAHDLRTPLTRLRTRLESALRHMDDPENREAIEGAVADADSLLATFAALLRIARAEAGSQKNFSDLDFLALVEEVADLYGPLAEDKELTFVSDAKPGLKARGDRNLVAQALANLVDNAIKYTESGTVVISATEQDGRAMLVVSDSGPGVADADKEKVLERLVRLEQSRTSPGSGLGLSLVKAVAKSHGADLHLRDNNPGLRVELVFPKVEVAVLPKAPGEGTAEKKTPKDSDKNARPIAAE